jgi:hypothetical protein
MTVAEFQALIATFPEEIAVVKFKGSEDQYPRAVWQESQIRQEYGSNLACTEKTMLLMEYMTKDEYDPHVQTIKNTFRSARMPFTCDVGYDPNNDVISYLFALYVEEAIQPIE